MLLRHGLRFGCLVVVALLACDRPRPATVRVATYNASLTRFSDGGLLAALATGADSQARTVAEVIQRVRPDILLLNEFDYDADGEAARLFHDRYLAVPQHITSATEPSEAIQYPYWYTASVNTGIASGLDLDRNGVVGQAGRDFGGDALGFGFFPGQFGMVVYSRFPVDPEAVRTFQNFRWRDMPDAQLPEDPETGAPWYPDEVLAVLPLSSKSHWDVPIELYGRVLHLLVSHPTPPVFDGPEDRNGRRNHDEIRFWFDYITPGAGEYIYDDVGVGGGLAGGTSFVIMGDQNADPDDGDSYERPIRLLLEHPAVNATRTPASRGGPEQSRMEGGANANHQGDPAYDTGDFDDASGPGNLRLDYVLPSADLHIDTAGVFWPARDDPLVGLVGASDHRLVWVDISGGWRRAAGAAAAE